MQSSSLLDFRQTSSNPRLAPHLAEFVQALNDRSPDFLFERCAVVEDFAVARRIHLDGSTVLIEKVVLTVENLDNETKPLAFVLSVDRSIFGLSTRLSFSSLVGVDLGVDEPFIVALGEASDEVTDRTNETVAALLRLQARTLSGL
jgi:hypothetical protein